MVCDLVDLLDGSMNLLRIMVIDGIQNFRQMNRPSPLAVIGHKPPGSSNPNYFTRDQPFGSGLLKKDTNINQPMMILGEVKTLLY
ncbi:hypothetical protein D3C72_1264570 [compost metagenome]